MYAYIVTILNTFWIWTFNFS